MIIEYGSAATGGCYHERSFNLACVFDGKGTTNIGMHLIEIDLSFVPFFCLEFALKIAKNEAAIP